MRARLEKVYFLTYFCAIRITFVIYNSYCIKLFSKVLLNTSCILESPNFLFLSEGRISYILIKSNVSFILKLFNKDFIPYHWVNKIYC